MKVQCELCPKFCIIPQGKSGDCRSRVNVDGELRAVTYGYPCAVHVDPIEKKPLFHFLPGTKAFSVACAGCNLHCKNCQNWEISQSSPVDVPAYSAPPDKLCSAAEDYNCETIAYTYTDPAIFYEYTLDCSTHFRHRGGRNVLVTAGYFNPEPLKALSNYVDGANVDLKALSETFYNDICSASLKPVLKSLEILVENGVHVEITNLVIPTLNDSRKDITSLCKWVKSNLGKEIPIHFSRFFPQYRMKNLPATSVETLSMAREIALSEGMEYVYVGNVIGKDWDNTFCPKCHKELISRRGYTLEYNNIKNGRCPICNYKIYGVWT